MAQDNKSTSLFGGQAQADARAKSLLSAPASNPSSEADAQPKTTTANTLFSSSASSGQASKPNIFAAKTTEPQKPLFGSASPADSKEQPKPLFPNSTPLSFNKPAITTNPASLFGQPASDKKESPAQPSLFGGQPSASPKPNETATEQKTSMFSSQANQPHSLFGSASPAVESKPLIKPAENKVVNDSCDEQKTFAPATGGVFGGVKIRDIKTSSAPETTKSSVSGEPMFKPISGGTFGGVKLWDKSSAQGKTVPPTIFGQPSASPKPTESATDKKSEAQAAKPSIFGGQATQSNPTKPNIFSQGTTEQKTAATTQPLSSGKPSIFANNSVDKDFKPVSGGFFSAGQPVTTAALFSKPAASTIPSPLAQAEQQSETPSVFGNSSAGNLNTGDSIFGNAASTSGASQTSIFAQTKPAQSIFVTQKTNPTPTTGPDFSKSLTSSAPLFGAPKPQDNTFNTDAVKSQNLFGQTTSPKDQNLLNTPQKKSPLQKESDQKMEEIIAELDGEQDELLTPVKAPEELDEVAGDDDALVFIRSKTDDFEREITSDQQPMSGQIDQHISQEEMEADQSQFEKLMADPANLRASPDSTGSRLRHRLSTIKESAYEELEPNFEEKEAKLKEAKMRFSQERQSYEDENKQKHKKMKESQVVISMRMAMQRKIIGDMEQKNQALTRKVQMLERRLAEQEEAQQVQPEDQEGSAQTQTLKVQLDYFTVSLLCLLSLFIGILLARITTA